jgi:hypothetical protein
MAAGLGRRIVTLSRLVVEELAEHLGPVGGPDAWVFTADKGGVLRPSNYRVKVWLPAIRAAGLAPLRPQRPAVHGKASNEEGPAGYRA